jgi:hypothetical protein
MAIKLKSTRLDTRDHHEQELYRRSPTSPKVLIRVQRIRSATSFTAVFGVEDSPKSIAVADLEITVDKLKKFEEQLVTCFKAARCHQTFPNLKKGVTEMIAPQLQSYFDDVLTIPGICIFQPFVELFQVDPIRFTAPPAK